MLQLCNDTCPQQILRKSPRQQPRSTQVNQLNKKQDILHQGYPPLALCCCSAKLVSLLCVPSETMCTLLVMRSLTRELQFALAYGDTTQPDIKSFDMQDDKVECDASKVQVMRAVPSLHLLMSLWQELCFTSEACQAQVQVHQKPSGQQGSPHMLSLALLRAAVMASTYTSATDGGMCVASTVHGTSSLKPSNNSKCIAFKQMLCVGRRGMEQCRRRAGKRYRRYR